MFQGVVRGEVAGVWFAGHCGAGSSEGLVVEYCALALIVCINFRFICCFITRVISFASFLVLWSRDLHVRYTILTRT